MKPGSILYAAICLLALTGLAHANVRGYVPFVVNAAAAAHGAANSFFHK
jgi:hypothetical protein